MRDVEEVVVGARRESLVAARETRPGDATEAGLLEGLAHGVLDRRLVRLAPAAGRAPLVAADAVHDREVAATVAHEDHRGKDSLVRQRVVGGDEVDVAGAVGEGHVEDAAHAAVALALAQPQARRVEAAGELEPR